MGMEQLSTLHAFKRHARPILGGLILGLTLIWAQNALAGTAQPTENIGEEAETCAKFIAQHERRQGIPAGLLNAISHAESGRWDAENREILAWPWTVTTGGKGYFLPSRVDAVAFVKSLQADGVENIDVGCMQINLKYHPDAFASIEQAFDPHANTAYAADFLRERFATSRSWIQAAGDYHSTTENLNKSYRAKVSKLWRGVKATAAAQAKSTAPTTPAKPAKPAAKPMFVKPVLESALPTQVAATTLARPDQDLTQRFNKSFQLRRQTGDSVGAGQVLANRARALMPGANLARASGSGATDGFAQKRQAQLIAWRQNTVGIQASMPAVPPSMAVLRAQAQ